MAAFAIPEVAVVTELATEELAAIVSRLLWNWLKDRVVDFVVTHVGAAIESAYDYVKGKLFGSKTHAEVTLEADVGRTTAQDLYRQVLRLLSKGEGPVKVARYQAARAKKLLPTLIEAVAARIPEDEPIIKWAKRVALAYGVTYREVLDMRRAIG